MFITMGDPVIIEFLSSLRNSFQIITIKNKIRTTTENPKELKYKQTYKEVLSQKWKEQIKQKILEKILNFLIKSNRKGGDYSSFYLSDLSSGFKCNYIITKDSLN